MKAFTPTIVILLLALMHTTQAQEPQVTLPALQASEIRYVFDCQQRRLPSQREVGEWMGQDNFSQVYDTRQRLMAEVGRACQGPGIAQVNLVLERPSPASADRAQWLVRAEPRRR